MSRREFLERLGRNPLDPYAPPQVNPAGYMIPDQRELDYRNFGWGVQGPAPLSEQYPQVFGGHSGSALLAGASGNLPNVNPAEQAPVSGPVFSPAMQQIILENLKRSGTGSMVPGSYPPTGGIGGSKGLIVPGNIDPFHRQAVKNPPGYGYGNTLSTSFMIEDPRHPYFNKQVLIPTIVNGAHLRPEDAMRHFYRTGQHFGIFDSIADAELYAGWMHNEQTRRAGDAP